MFRIALAVFITFAGYSHLTFHRSDFQAQVPDWVPMSKDMVVILSGIVEIVLGVGIAFWKSQRAKFGWALTIFFVLIFPGNLDQYIHSKNSFGGMDNDTARFIRLFFQPVLIVWALWCTGAWQSWKINRVKNKYCLL